MLGDVEYYVYYFLHILALDLLNFLNIQTSSCSIILMWYSVQHFIFQLWLCQCHQHRLHLFSSFYLGGPQKSIHYVWPLQMHCEILSCPNVELLFVAQVPVNSQLSNTKLLLYRRNEALMCIQQVLCFLHCCKDKDQKTMSTGKTG